MSINSWIWIIRCSNKQYHHHNLWALILSKENKFQTIIYIRCSWHVTHMTYSQSTHRIKNQVSRVTWLGQVSLPYLKATSTKGRLKERWEPARKVLDAGRWTDRSIDISRVLGIWWNKGKGRKEGKRRGNGMPKPKMAWFSSCQIDRGWQAREALGSFLLPHIKPTQWEDVGH